MTACVLLNLRGFRMSLMRFYELWWSHSSSQPPAEVEVREGGRISPFYSRETKSHWTIQGQAMTRRLLQRRALAVPYWCCLLLKEFRESWPSGRHPGIPATHSLAGLWVQTCHSPVQSLGLLSSKTGPYKTGPHTTCLPPSLQGRQHRWKCSEKHGAVQT